MSGTKRGVLVLAILMAFCWELPFFSVYAGSSTINISDGKIAGEKVGYYFTIPLNIRPFVGAERVYEDDGSLIEKFVLLCYPDTSSPAQEGPSPLAYLSVYKKLAWVPKDGVEEIFRTKDYVFIYEKSKTTFTNKLNITNFNYCQKDVATVEQIRPLMSLPESQPVEYSNTVFVNNKPLNTKLIEQGKDYLLPFRELCEAMGYTVKWDEERKLVSIKKGGFYDSFQMNYNTQFANGFAVKLVNGRTYMALGYFVMKLAFSTEVGRNKNIYFKSK